MENAKSLGRLETLRVFFKISARTALALVFSGLDPNPQSTPTDSVVSFDRLISSDASRAEPLAPAEYQAWFTTAILPHEDALRRWLRSRFPHLDVDDLVQESFLRIFRFAANEPVSYPKAYLFTTARNLALRRIRHERQRSELVETDPSEIIDDKPGIPEAVARRQEHDLLIEALQSLPERARQVFTLRRVYNLPLKEIAAQLRLSEKTVEAHISLALRRCTDFVQNADARAAQASELARLSSTTLKPSVRHA